MKHILLSIFISSVSYICCAQNPLINGGFETWSFSKPNNWKSSRKISQSNYKNSGSSAVYGYHHLGEDYSILSLGDVDGQAISERYTHLSFYYNFQAERNVFLKTELQMKDSAGNTIGYINMSLLDTTPGYHYIDFDISYVQETQPVKCNLVIYPEGIFPHSSASFYIDDVRLFNKTATSINNIQDEGHFDIYPNPASSVLYIVPKASLQKCEKVELYDLIGNRIQETIFVDYSLTMDISNIPAGIYIAIIKAKDSYVTRKVNITN